MPISQMFWGRRDRRRRRRIEIIASFRVSTVVLLEYLLGTLGFFTKPVFRRGMMTMMVVVTVMTISWPMIPHRFVMVTLGWHVGLKVVRLQMACSEQGFERLVGSAAHGVSGRQSPGMLLVHVLLNLKTFVMLFCSNRQGIQARHRWIRCQNERETSAKAPGSTGNDGH